MTSGLLEHFNICRCAIVAYDSRQAERSSLGERAPRVRAGLESPYIVPGVQDEVWLEAFSDLFDQPHVVNSKVGEGKDSHPQHYVCWEPNLPCNIRPSPPAARS